MIVGSGVLVEEGYKDVISSPSMSFRGNPEVNHVISDRYQNLSLRLP
jgi:hypothetical protein